MQDEFSFKDQYPHKAGHRKVDTSIEVAEKVNKTLKRVAKIVLLELEKVYPKGLTGTEIANKCNRSILSVRPRTTELKLLGLIIDTEERRIDNTIYFYVEDEVIKGSAKFICENCLDEPMKFIEEN